jgi:hypothetical protein
MKLNYQDSVTFVVVESGGYRGGKEMISQHDVNCIFIQSIGFVQAGFQESLDADAICYPDPENEFVMDNSNRLEGMYVKAPLFDVNEDEAWYKVETVRVNRDHLLTNNIDNVELLLKKTRPIQGVS